MHRFMSLCLVLLLVAIPAIAQTTLGETYITETGTTIEYPIGWTIEIEDNLIIISQGTNSRIVLLDYPLVNDLANNQAAPLDLLVEVVANEVIGDAINSDQIQFDTVLNREFARYDIRANSGLASGSVLAVRFSNDRIGMLVSINVSEITLQSILSTFDNINPPDDAVSLGAGVAGQAEAYIFRTGGRFSYPIGWEYSQKRRGELEYVTLANPNNEAAMILFDVTNIIPNNLPLNRVLDDAGLRLAQNFAVTVNADTVQVVRVGNREGLRYSAVISLNGETIPAEVTIVRFSDVGIGVAVAYGQLNAYASQINFVISSFNNLGAIINFKS